jgi:hypothetical protein
MDFQERCDSPEAANHRRILLKKKTILHVIEPGNPAPTG